MNEKHSLGLFKQLAYSSGYMGIVLASEIIGMWLIFFYAPPEGIVFVPILLIGGVAFFGRVMDAVSSPIMGYFSDRSKSRFGRRIPFIAIGTPLLVATLIFIFRPPVATESVINVLYLTVMLGLFWIFFSAVATPHHALLPELVSTVRERINLANYVAIFGALGLFITFAGSGYLIEHHGFGLMAIVMGVIVFVSLYILVIFIREKPWSSAKEVDLSFTAAIKHCLANRPFLYYVIAFTLTMMGLTLFGAAVPFIVTVLMGAPPEWAGYALGIAMGVALLSFPIVNYLAKKFGKKIVFAASILLFSVFASLLATIGMLPISPFYHGLLLIAIIGIPFSSVLMLPFAIIADTIDYDETITGFRREASYFGVQALIWKAGLGVSAVLLTLLLHHFGKTIAEPLGIILAGPAAGIIPLIGFFVFLKYPFKK
jgi:GPH family glycoside/pentoside/hexuronide:cation symporter